VKRLLVLALLLSGCVSPSRTDRDYELKAGNTAKAVASSVATALLGAQAAEKHKAGGPYLTVLLVNAEKDALSVQSTFDSVQPPSSTADGLKDQVDELVTAATAGLSEMRTLVRRGELGALPGLAHRLRPTLDDLQTFADRYQ
jgi:hypothetical protein